MTRQFNKAPRRMRGFERTSGLLQDRIRKAGETRGFAVARLLTHWAEIVGEEIARHRPAGQGQLCAGRLRRDADGADHRRAGPDAGNAEGPHQGAGERLLRLYRHCRIRITQTAPDRICRGAGSVRPCAGAAHGRMTRPSPEAARQAAAPVSDDEPARST